MRDKNNYKHLPKSINTHWSTHVKNCFETNKLQIRGFQKKQSLAFNTTETIIQTKPNKYIFVTFKTFLLFKEV